MQYIATIYFDADKDVNVKEVLMAGFARMEDYDKSVVVVDYTYSEDNINYRMIKQLHPTLKKCKCGFIGTKPELYKHFKTNEVGLEHGEVPYNLSFTCSQCGMTSYHPRDVEHQYCGNCHQFFT